MLSVLIPRMHLSRAAVETMLLEPQGIVELGRPHLAHRFTDL